MNKNYNNLHDYLGKQFGYLITEGKEWTAPGWTIIYIMYIIKFLSTVYICIYTYIHTSVGVGVWG